MPMRLPYVTADLPGVAASFKVTPEDFRVDEVPAYLPSGEGEHLYVLVEKRGRESLEVARELARAFGVRQADVGMAGQKDRQALTTQWMSLPGVPVERAIGSEGEGWRVLEARRHGNKLRTGHLRGNRFRILLRGALEEEDRERMLAVAEALAQRGLPNFYGPQRFGRNGNNAELGKRILLGEHEDPEVRRALRQPRIRRLLVSAFQSAVFNRVLAARMEAGTWDRPMAGDVLQRLPSGRPFLCTDPEADAPRVRSFECSITGPMPGGRMFPAPEGEPARLEAEALEATGVQPEHLAASRDAEGARRAFRIPVEVDLTWAEEGAWLDFALPSGAYATTVIREFTKAG